MTDSTTLAPSDAQLESLAARLLPIHSRYWTDTNAFARAVLAKWGAPATASQPVAVPAVTKPFGYVTTVRESRIVGDERKRLYTEFTAEKPEGDAEAVFTAAQVQAMLKVRKSDIDLAPGWQAVPVEQLRQLLADAHTAAGLVSHGKQCKALGVRLSDAVMATYAELAAAPQPAAPSGPALEPLEPDMTEVTNINARIAYRAGWRASERAHSITAAQKGGKHGAE